MPFCNNPNNPRFPGTIRGNPLNGLCERVCLNVKKVFDACVRQITREDFTLTVIGYDPPNPAPPLTFVSARSSAVRGVLSDVQIDKLADRPKEARVRCNVTSPLEIFYVDGNNVSGVATSQITVANDVVMCVPARSVMPYELEAAVSVICPDGSFSGGALSVDACITCILKITAEADILVPAYGYAEIPPAEEYDNQICSTFFELPLFP
jgi:hypothetical protein